MRSLLGRFHRPMSRGAMGDMLTMNSLGDGSTLSLDFTAMGGTLDPRITFSRTSPATFINSLGYVEYAASNLLQNSEWDGSTTPTNWSLGGNAPTIPSTGSRTFTTTTAATSYIVNGGISLSQGITYSAVIEVSNVVGSPIMINTIVATASPSNEKWYQDGVLASGSSQVITAGTITYTFTAGSGSNIRNGVGSTGGAVSNQSVTITKPRVVPGINIGATYYPSTTSAAYHAPRFTFSETSIGTPRGLLLEAPATNHQFSSEVFSTSFGYSDSDILSRTTGTSPSNGTAIGFYPTLVVPGYHRLQYGAGVTLSGAVTVSMWFKRLNSNYRAGINAGGLIAASVIVDLNGAGSIVAIGGSAANRAATITRYPNDWYRVALTGTFAASTSIYFFMDSSTSTDSTGGPFVGGDSQGMLMWGGQIETGSQASSYIETANTSVTRAVDTAIIAAGSNFSSWYTGGTTGTFVANWYGSAATPTARSVIATSDQTTKHLHMYQTASALTLRLADFPVTTVTTANSLTANALTKGAFSYAASATSLCLNGGTVATGTLAFSAAPTWLSIGGPSTNGTSITTTTVMLNNSIRTLKYFPTRLSDGQIQGLTT